MRKATFELQVQVEAILGKIELPPLHEHIRLRHEKGEALRKLATECEAAGLDDQAVGLRVRATFVEMPNVARRALGALYERGMERMTRPSNIKKLSNEFDEAGLKYGAEALRKRAEELHQQIATNDRLEELDWVKYTSIQ